VTNKTSSADVGAPRDALRFSGVKGHWDEALLPSGLPRRHWRRLSAAIARMGLAELNRRWQSGQQLIHAHDLSYDVGSQPEGRERPWPMDPIPLVIDEKEWAQIETAVIQRARLLDAMLRDFYGEQRLLHDRQIPPELLFANPHFLRPCHGAVPRNGVYLHSYAADLARSPSGSWWVIADRTQAPSGVAYALENRLVSARTLPTLFNRYQVRPLLPFVEAQRNALLALAAGVRSEARADPRVVLLTAGPQRETFFEDSFLAGHWGFPLVEGADLAVRDGQVFLKTLAGIEPVDLIVRHMDDSMCDPLELRGESLLGVPGLLQAVRRCTVIIDNALGSGVVETPGQMAFLPGLCQRLLGEDLRMPSVATWWCGQEHARRYVLEHLDELTILPTFPRFSLYQDVPSPLTDAMREELAHRIEAQPEQFVAQERVALSTAPVRTASGFEPRKVLLRVFAAREGESYRVLPGSLTRVSSEETSHFLSIQLGGGSKDTWVLGGMGETPLARTTEVQPPEVSFAPRPSQVNLPSRVVDNLFWLGRYAERVETTVRLVRALLPALSGEDDPRHPVSLEAAIRLLIGLRYLPPETASASLAEQLWQLRRLLSEMLYDRARLFGLGWNLKEMRRVAWNVKERLSLDTWHVLQQIDADFSRRAPADPRARDSAQIGLLDRVIVTLSAFSGLLMENTTRGHGWRFLEVGRRLERTLQMAEILRSGLADAPPDEIESHLQVLLHIADSTITYRTRYLTELRLDLLLELLLSDESNPRSIGFQLLTLVKHVENLPRHDGPEEPSERETAWQALRAVRHSLVANLCWRDDSGFSALDQLIGEIKKAMHTLSDALTLHYLSPVTMSLLRSS